MLFAKLDRSFSIDWASLVPTLSIGGVDEHFSTDDSLIIRFLMGSFPLGSFPVDGLPTDSFPLLARIKNSSLCGYEFECA